MTRVKRGVTAHRRHLKVLKAAKGFRGARSKLYTRAKTALYKAGENAFRDRKRKKRTFRGLWIARINAACRLAGTRYGLLIDAMFKKNIQVNRKILADLAVRQPEAFKAILDEAMKK